MDLDLKNFRRPINFLNNVSRDTEKIFFDQGDFPKEFDNLCLKRDVRVLNVDFDLYHRDEKNFPIIINHALSLHNSFINFLSDPFKYTTKNSFKKWLFTFTDHKDRGVTKFNYNNRSFSIDQVESVSKVIDYDMVQWIDWKEKYETFFKLVWLLDDYLYNGKFDFPMGLRTIRNRHTQLTDINQFVAHPGGTRQTIAKLFGGPQPFITDDGRKKHLLKNYIISEHNIKSLDDLLEISNNKNKKKAKVDKLNSTIIFYPQTKEYEFNFNAVNYINYKIGDYVKGWFKRVEGLKLIEIIDATPKQMFFIKELLPFEWSKSENSPGKLLINSIKFVNNFSGDADIEVRLSPKIDTQFIIIPFLLGTSFNEVRTKSGFLYRFKSNDPKVNKNSITFKELYTDCYYTDSLIERKYDQFCELSKNKPLI